jgi:hypothetical protein
MKMDEVCGERHFRAGGCLVQGMRYLGGRGMVVVLSTPTFLSPDQAVELSRALRVAAQYAVGCEPSPELFRDGMETDEESGETK